MNLASQRCKDLLTKKLRSVMREHFSSPLAAARRLAGRSDDRPQATLDLLLHQSFIAAFDLVTTCSFVGGIYLSERDMN